MNVLEGDPQPTVATDASEAGAGEIVISGTGSIVTEDFHLDAGRYEATVTIETGCCIAIFLYGPAGEELLFNEIFDFDDEGGTATDIYVVPEAGTYFIDSQNTDSPWTVTFKPR